MYILDDINYNIVIVGFYRKITLRSVIVAVGILQNKLKDNLIKKL